MATMAKKIVKKIQILSLRVAKEVVYLVNPTSSSLVLFVVGCQRSGTTIMMDTLEKDFHIKVYPETSRLSSDDNIEHVRLNNIIKLKMKLEKDRAPIIALKPLVETQKIKILMNEFDKSKSIFMYRHYKDVSLSNLKKFGLNNGIKNLRPIFHQQEDNWRAENVSQETKDIVRKFFSEEMNPFDAAALFWWVRNRLFFELGLADDERVMLCRYEDLVADPNLTFHQIYSFLDHRTIPKKRLKGVHSSSLGRGQKVELSNKIEDLCFDLLQQLDAVNFQGKREMSHSKKINYSDSLSGRSVLSPR